ncbi:hypothetical protein HW115_10585 [Verrucomicrobiaceae bacterium N1E253]|uniref:Uncharacterized protein n=1 Tax=Oceaniferula marina TaxID=2748318 RepID=A0A851GFS9_9BACT|nr:hypothetical protein [Oceaniferula marina]NWK56059.1 hypothetical protein [Oceaniferula marina]
MTISKHSLLKPLTAVAMTVFGSVPGTLVADIIELQGGDVLTGDIKALDAKTVTLQSPLTPTPLAIKAEHIGNISFSAKESTPEKHNEQLTLSNGDILPCQVIALNDQSLQISTWYAGDFNIPREHLRALQFGLQENKLIYQGNDDPSQWTTREGRWSYNEGKGYQCQNVGTLARKLELSENLLINLSLVWKESPNFAFRFCAENDKATTKQNCYELTFNSSGLKISRCLTNRTQISLASINLKPHEIDEQKLDVELRVDRKTGKITLLLDGAERGFWMDTFEAPEGNYIILNNRSNRGYGFFIDQLTVRNWNAGNLRKLTDKKYAETSDLLADINGEHLTGKLLTINKGAEGGLTVSLSRPHATKPAKVPGKLIDTLFFGRDKDSPTVAQGNYTVEFVGGGQLQLQSPTLDRGKITTKHPILGNCTIDTSAVSRITQRKNTP